MKQRRKSPTVPGYVQWSQDIRISLEMATPEARTHLLDCAWRLAEFYLTLDSDDAIASTLLGILEKEEDGWEPEESAQATVLAEALADRITFPSRQLRLAALKELARRVEREEETTETHPARELFQ